MADKIVLKDYVQEFTDTWLDELILHGRAFPDFRDGLKDSTRSILTATARRAKYSRSPVPADALVGDVPGYRETAEKNIEKNLFRMASSNTPLIEIVSKDEGRAKGLNRITGNYSKPRYVSLSLTPLGEYVFKYRDYFDRHQSDNDGTIEKYDYIKTPIPLSLLIPQVNLSDGFSNKAPNLNILQVIDAYIEHVKKDKQTTTEDLAQHIKGFELTPGTKVLMSNQSLFDLIERGVAKAVTLAPIKFYEGEIVIQELPFRQFGNTIRDELDKLHRKPAGKNGGFESFKITGYSPEQSKESMITLNYEINPGYTVKDVKAEIYNKTSLKERIVYENLCLDPREEKPLTIKSIREVLDYHVDLGLELKEREITDEIKNLENERDEAEFLEKLTRKICVDIIGRIIGEPNRDELAAKYLNDIFGIMEEITFGNFDTTRLKDYPHIEDVISKHTVRLREIAGKDYGEVNDETLRKALDKEVPTGFDKDQLSKIFLKQYEVLYNLNKRKRAIDVLRSFARKLQNLLKLMQRDHLKNVLIKEMEDLRKKYETASFSETLFALKIQEREERKRLKRKMVFNIKRMEDSLPVNVIIDNSLTAYPTVDPTLQIPNAKQVMQLMSDDQLVILNRKGNSYKIPVIELSKEGSKLGDPDDNLAIITGEYYNPLGVLYIFVTNQGRVIVCDRDMLLFNNKNLQIPLDEDERFIYFNAVPEAFFIDRVSLLLKTDNNLIKKKRLDEFTVKSRFNEFFNLFAGNSKTDLVTSAAIVPTNDSMLHMWSKDGLDRVVYDSGFKRNVSYGEPLPYDKLGAFIIDEMIPVIDGNIVTDLNSITNASDFNKLGDILLPLNHEELNKRISLTDISQIEWVKMYTSLTRRRFKMTFAPDDIQVEAFMSRFN